MNYFSTSRRFTSNWHVRLIWAVTLFCCNAFAAEAFAAEDFAADVDAPLPSTSTKYVIIVSFDGGNPDVMKRSAMPTFERMAREGASTMTAQTTFPSLTLPAHASMLTGVTPAKHKIYWNDYRPKLGLVGVPTVFSVARAANPNLKTAMFVGKDKFKHFDLPDSLDHFEVIETSAKDVAQATAAYIASDKPNLLFVHFADSDTMGHEYGWNTPEQIAAFEDEDVALTILENAIKAAGLVNETTFILTADHGGHDKGHGTAMPVDMTIPWVIYGASVKPKFAVIEAVTTYDTSATALILLGVPVPANWDGKPVLSALELLQSVGTIMPLPEQR